MAGSNAPGSSIAPASAFPIPGFEQGVDEPCDSTYNEITPIDTTPSVLSTNAPRALPRRRSRYAMRGGGRGFNGVSTFIPNPQNAPDPMQRWQESPPEDEPASLSAIMESLKKYPAATDQTTACGLGTGSPGQVHNSFRGYRHRTASVPSSRSSALSVSSQPSSTSTRSATSQKSQGRPRSHKKGTTGRVRKGRSAKMNPAEKGRRFCCTFCCDQFRTKYDWLDTRSGTVVSSSTGKEHCAFCNALDPTPEHLDGHKYQSCISGTRTFRRKDHLVQHLRRTHRLETLPPIDDWKVQGPPVTSRCGFCDLRLSSWEERIDHLGNHFRSGSTMDDWRGDHDFPSEIAKLVVNSLPPYHIGSDSRVLVPFSATNFHHYDHVKQICSRLEASESSVADHILNVHSQLEPLEESAYTGPWNNMIEVLVFHLTRYTRQQMEQGIIPTDEMLQQESRRLVYDCEDSWNQTIFDNPEWIAEFRRQHIDQIANADREGGCITLFSFFGMLQMIDIILGANMLLIQRSPLPLHRVHTKRG
ncbi:uncharacterized protein BO97DRAFT_435846 [Aspergillus homomorphus CBS 101889]|uniref:C2H2-type domain-containing protein n=1 Tax=Aspergillus homomorphus (strain CBS 101889) TaxID=1450537 RepID=A0A395HS01_ASPHC|nr:hypothetical protein BO97DRAFT_435846 [Aspergillus homomorphus CBS 101889]RAL10731.1 hypothetical protein BO97DRAFT_435846 [Aspergillus homomorphus CBS 101889]